MASPISALQPQSTSPANTSSTAGITKSKPVNEQVFLTLLVAQIKNQDPLNPTDGTQFVSQLAQFSELEQVIAIRTAVESQTNSNTPPAAGTTPAAGTASK